MSQVQRSLWEQRDREVGNILLDHMKQNPDQLVKEMLDYYADVRNSLEICRSVLREIRKGIETGKVVIEDSDLKTHLHNIFF